MKSLYPLIWLIKKSRILSAASMRLVKLTGKSRYTIHPKHLIRIETPWYLARIKKGDVVLDLGCNNGQQTLKIAPKCRRIIGIDNDQKQLAIARASLTDTNFKNVEYFQHNLEKKLKFASRSFDKIIFLDVLEHIVNRQQILKEVKRVLKREGMAFVSVPNSETSWKKLQRAVGLDSFADPDHKIEYTEAEIRRELTAMGFKIINLKPVTYDTPWVGFFDLIGGLSLPLYGAIARYKKQKAQRWPIESTGFRLTLGLK